jgi:hypothetical protein
MATPKKKPAKKITDSELIKRLFPSGVRKEVTKVTRPIREKKLPITPAR